ncbi:serine hydrolase domain-containing protein [Ferruginibacter sp.]|nr:beta-lactamase family protein [Ferruginibacter sp.]
MKKNFAFTLFFASVYLLLITPICVAQQIQTNAKPNAHIDMQRLSRIDDLVNGYINKNWLTGAVTLVIKDNQLVQYKGYGLADISTKKAMPNDAIFRIMSQTKAITSAGILILYEHGKLLLDEPIANFIPAFKNPVVLDKFNAADSTYTTVPAKRDITFRDLLTHTSGIDYAGIGSQDMKAIYAKAGVPSGLGFFDAHLLEKMNVLAKLPLKNQPGEKFLYGLNTDLLGCLIEVISGTTLDDFFKKNIFEPLGMKDTYFNVPATKASRMAGVYTEDAEHRIIPWLHEFRNIDPDYPLMNKKYFSGGAGLSSTAFDYAIFLQMLLNGGKYNGHQILSPRIVELMISGQLDFTIGANKNNFGLGFEITSDKAAAKLPRNLGSFAWGGYYGTTYWADPKAHLICLIMTQQSPNSHGDLSAKFEAMVYSSLK